MIQRPQLLKKLTQSGLDITKTTQALFLFLLITRNVPHVTLQYIFLLQLKLYNGACLMSTQMLAHLFKFRVHDFRLTHY